MKKYKTIVIDPPWQYNKWGKANPKSRPNSISYPMPYETMSINKIKNLPIYNLIDKMCGKAPCVLSRKLLPIS